jgi:hypothetical protein
VSSRCFPGHATFGEGRHLKMFYHSTPNGISEVILQVYSMMDKTTSEKDEDPRSTASSKMQGDSIVSVASAVYCFYLCA